MKNLEIAANIKIAHTPPSEFYRSQSVFEEVTEKIFARSWLYLADAHTLKGDNLLTPFHFLEGVLDEPLLISSDPNQQLQCLSNVCTHRGKILVEQRQSGRMISCPYHGRCFRLDGSFKSMPAFESAKNFPAEADHLSKIPFREWLGMIYVSLNPRVDFEELIGPIEERVGWLPMEKLYLAPRYSKDFLLKANWALYCDNYLEGLHIPFVHPSLNEALSYDDYQYELFPYCNLQLGIAKEGEPVFDIPKDSPDYGKKIYAYYFWVFPNLMFNIYPWGISFNDIQPLSKDLTRVKFRNYFFEETDFEKTYRRLDETEYEDESVVESVQKGMKSRFYHRGRFSPTTEQCVHHFHRLIAEFMND